MNKCRRGVASGFCQGLMCELSLEIHAELARVVGRESDCSIEEGEGDTFDRGHQAPTFRFRWSPVGPNLIRCGTHVEQCVLPKSCLSVTEVLFDFYQTPEISHPSDNYGD